MQFVSVKEDFEINISLYTFFFQKITEIFQQYFHNIKVLRAYVNINKPSLVSFVNANYLWVSSSQEVEKTPVKLGNSKYLHL